MLGGFINEDFLVIITRVLVALVLSGMIGFEREFNNHSAGFRTHILVGIGSCLMMLLSLYGFEEFITKYDNVRFDPARIPSYVVSGIGFLGAGTIMVNGGTIRGLTTAASIWAVAGLGLVIGVGMYGTAIFTTLVILLSLIFLNNFEKRFKNGRKLMIIEIIALPKLNLGEVVQILDLYKLEISNMEILKVESGMRKIYIKMDKKEKFDRYILLDKISKMEYVSNISEKS